MSKKPSPDSDLITGEQFFQLGDIGQCELIDGEIVFKEPGDPLQSFITCAVGLELDTFVRRNKLGQVLMGEVGLYIRRDPDRIRTADAVFISAEKLPELTNNFLELAPELVVEVASGGDQSQATQAKIEDYFSIGVKQVWLVEPGNRKLFVYNSMTDTQEFGDTDTLHGQEILPGLELDVGMLFQ